MALEMDKTEKNEQLAETRRAEAIALFTSSQGYNARNDQLVALGVTVIGAAATLGLKEHFEEVLLGVPPALVLLLTYAFQVDADVRIMGVARRRLEEVLERQLGGPGLIYQSHAIQFRRGSYIYGIEWAKYLLLLVAVPGTAVAGCLVAHDIRGWILSPLYALLLLALVACLVRAWSDGRRAERDAEQALKAWAGDE